MRSLLVLIPTLLGSCSLRQAACGRDTDCAASEVCYHDLHCLPRDVASRAGAPIGDECAYDEDCLGGFCRTGYCLGGAPLPPPDGPVADGPVTEGGPAPDGPAPPDGPRPDGGMPDASGDTTPPTFVGLAGAYPDGEGAVLVYWRTPTDDMTLPAFIEILIYRGDSPATIDLTRPVATVSRDRWWRDTGLMVGRTYAYVGRARDAAGNVEQNTQAVSADARAAVVVPPGVDWMTDVAPILQSRCGVCHGGASGLTVTTYERLMAGGTHGPVVMPCRPEESNLYMKLTHEPPFGVRMPRNGPPYLPMDEIATIRQWIVDGARETYAASACAADGGVGP